MYHALTQSSGNRPVELVSPGPFLNWPCPKEGAQFGPGIPSSSTKISRSQCSIPSINNVLSLVFSLWISLMADYLPCLVGCNGGVVIGPCKGDFERSFLWQAGCQPQDFYASHGVPAVSAHHFHFQDFLESSYLRKQEGVECVCDLACFINI